MALLAQRLVVLAAVALLGAVAALAFVERRSEGGTGEGRVVSPSLVTWNTAFAGSRGPTGDAQRTSCGQVLTPESYGVTHAVLPCGARLLLRNDGKLVQSEVIDNVLVEPGRQLEVTEALAAILGIEDTVEVEWRFAPEESP